MTARPETRRPFFVNESVMCHDLRVTTRRKGPAPGTPRASGIRYDPESGAPWRSGVVFQCPEAVKVIRAAQEAHISVNGLLVELIRRMPVDGEGRPLLDGLHIQEEVTKKSA